MGTTDDNQLPDDWEAQVARAYATLGIDPMAHPSTLGGADEFGGREQVRRPKGTNDGC